MSDENTPGSGFDWNKIVEGADPSTVSDSETPYAEEKHPSNLTKEEVEKMIQESEALVHSFTEQLLQMSQQFSEKMDVPDIVKGHSEENVAKYRQTAIVSAYAYSLGLMLGYGGQEPIAMLAAQIRMEMGLNDGTVGLINDIASGKYKRPKKD